jgi:hypothetical protein
MKTRKINKSGWGPGPWQDEPDTLMWMDRGYACEIMRSGSIGHLCGYVTVPITHPWHGVFYDDAPVANITVHGGITYAEADDKGWKVGFDCAHLYDLLPGHKHPPIEEATYRDLDFVKEQVRQVVDQAVDAYAGEKP